MNPPLAPPQVAAGGVIGGRFQILARIASGGMGTVYRALDTATGQPVALKILSQGPGAHAVSRLVREAEILAQLQSPGIVRYIADGFTESGVFFLVMEWLEGHDLARHLALHRLDVASCLLLARQVASALAVAHQAGIIHRDLKPSKGTPESSPPDLRPAPPRSTCSQGACTRNGMSSCCGSPPAEGAGTGAAQAGRHVARVASPSAAFIKSTRPFSWAEQSIFLDIRSTDGLIKSHECIA